MVNKYAIVFGLILFFAMWSIPNLTHPDTPYIKSFQIEKETDGLFLEMEVQNNVIFGLELSVQAEGCYDFKKQINVFGRSSYGFNTHLVKKTSCYDRYFVLLLKEHSGSVLDYRIVDMEA